MFAAARDVTERKRMEERLRAASQYARSLIEASLDPLVTISPEGKITDVNEATEQVTGVPRERLIGSRLLRLLHRAARRREEGYRKVLSEGLVRDYPLTIRHVEGRTTDVLYNATVYRNEAGQVQGVFAAARDVTERKRLEEELRVASLYARSLLEASLDPAGHHQPRRPDHGREPSHRTGDRRAARQADRQRLFGLLYGAGQGSRRLPESSLRGLGPRLPADHSPPRRPHHRRALQRGGIPQRSRPGARRLRRRARRDRAQARRSRIGPISRTPGRTRAATNRRAGNRQRPPAAHHRGAGQLQPGTGAIRVCGIPRPPGAAAGRDGLPRADRTAARGPSSRTRSGIMSTEPSRAPRACTRSSPICWPSRAWVPEARPSSRPTSTPCSTRRWRAWAPVCGKRAPGSPAIRCPPCAWTPARWRSSSRT